MCPTLPWWTCRVCDQRWCSFSPYDALFATVVFCLLLWAAIVKYNSQLPFPSAHTHTNVFQLVHTSQSQFHAWAFWARACISGLTKVPIDGQPMSIVQELEDMARQYIKGDNAIILAVTPANADLATSDALRLAREVDPSGERTIGEGYAFCWSSGGCC